MDWTEFWINIFLPVLTILIPVFTTIYTVNRRVENENKESHKPYLVLHKIEKIKRLDVLRYHLMIIGRNYRSQNHLLSDEELAHISRDEDLNVEFYIRNIGYGVATNIRFYDLLSGKEIYGTQESSKEQNQKLFTTFDIASMEEKTLQACVISYLPEEEGMMKEEHNRILCVYKDLNDHIYSFIISINIKNKEYYDFFAYQPSSRSYKKWIKQNKKQYHIILEKYSRL